MISINREELAWAAGFFDGEGCTSTQRARGILDYNIGLAISQIERSVLMRFQKAVGGLGNLFGPYRHHPERPKRNSIYFFRAGSYQEVQAIGAMLWPFLSEPKRQQFSNTILRWRSAPMRRYNKRRHRRQI